ncbi:dimethylarginine dimethylaminohydrolase family protein [Blastococcus sp. PRF04-17]|uniref:dimethylarginine dimethylaminohydrolase family protein n=1 Tax=Blastococcus sp. PRF04-17 TaxID=2933797 RepID=UPI001FF1EF47|nr:arginine deiminase family protein [Blastococcus sp. PRF04-17]UOY02254.1 arginine deiminase family protein [Blastococcus sp. PRF04-17]
MDLTDFPGYRPDSVVQYADYHAEVDFLDELERIWGQRWGAQGIGRLRQVAMSPPTEVEVLSLYDEAPAFFAYGGDLPDLGLMREQHAHLMETYRSLGIEVREFVYPETPRSAYGVMKRAVSAAAGFVVNGGAIIAREAAPYWRGRSRYVSQYLSSIGCPILATVHGKGVCEGGAFTRMADDLIVAMLSTDANQEGIDQVRPVLERAGYTVWVARSPGPLHDFHPEVPGWMHSDMWIAPLDTRLALIYPPWCDYETIRYLRSIGYTLIEVPRDEQESHWPVNMITIEPRKVIMNEGSPKTRALLEKAGVETIEIPYDEVQRYGGGIRCTTMQLVRDPGPKVFG